MLSVSSLIEVAILMVGVIVQVRVHRGKVGIFLHYILELSGHKSRATGLVMVLDSFELLRWTLK